MNTPIYDFVKAYNDLRPARFHMPGHKGRGPLGCEDLDLTEIPGADSLYEAAGIIAESEANASKLFGCPTFYSTEGSSHCIRAMLLLASHVAPAICRQSDQNAASWPADCRRYRGFLVLAARNVHSAFLTAAALLDLDVVWLPVGGAGSYLSAHPTPEVLDAALAETGAGAVYLTCPDYLGELPDLRPLAAVCHAHGALLLVDNAHGAYLRFLTPSRHPMDLGADLCCDSAHKTLPVLTGGAYLHVSQALAGVAIGRPPEAAGTEMQNAKCKMQNDFVRDALALFGSTSPSYLILQSLDLANPWLETLPEKLADFLPKVEALKARLRAAGWTLTGDEPLKLTLRMSGSGVHGENGFFASLRMTETTPGSALAAALEQEGVFCEFADPEHVVFLLSPNNTDEELERLEAALNAVGSDPLIAPVIAGGNDAAATRRQEASRDASLRFCSLRGAMLAPAVRVPAGESLGRVLARPGVSCPPAVPILMPGEIIDEDALAAFEKYGIGEVSVLL